jgi:hypothetical protein
MRRRRRFGSSIRSIRPTRDAICTGSGLRIEIGRNDELKRMLLRGFERHLIVLGAQFVEGREHAGPGDEPAFDAPLAGQI